MKRFLKRLLTPQQFHNLSRVKNEALPGLRYKIVQWPFQLVGLTIKALPGSSQVTLKSGIRVIRKMDYQRRDIFLDVDSDFEYRIRLHSCRKEPDTVEWIETFLKEGEVLYDIGANSGVYSLVASKFLDGKVIIYAFEPAFLNFTQLCKNLVLNQEQDNVVPLPIALSDQTSIASFNFDNMVPGGAMHTLGDPVNSEGRVFKPTAQQPVLSYRGDDLIRQFGIKAPNHIKIDVDGNEFAVLKGMEKTLIGASVKSVLLELNEGRGQGQQVQEFLSDKGFSVHSNYGANYVFIRE